MLIPRYSFIRISIVLVPVFVLCTVIDKEEEAYIIYWTHSLYWTHRIILVLGDAAKK